MRAPDHRLLPASAQLQRFQDPVAAGVFQVINDGAYQSTDQSTKCVSDVDATLVVLDPNVTPVICIVLGSRWYITPLTVQS